MTPLKFILYAVFYLALGICASYALLDGMADKQAQREAVFQARLDGVRAGESTRIAGYQWMKISERKVSHD